MSFQALELPLRRSAVNATPVRVSRVRARVPVAFIKSTNTAWDGHDLVVISKYDVILD